MGLELLFLYLTGVFAGFINLLAGGGSLLTLPFLILFIGLDPALANGTNRLGLAFGALTGIKNFKDKGFFDLSIGLQIGIPAIFGAILGSLFAIEVSGALFKKILAAVMVFMLYFIVKGSKNDHSHHLETPGRLKKLIIILTFFAVGFYGGFIQIGIGFIIMFALSLLFETSLIRINSLKVFLVFTYMLFSLGVFILHQKVHWGYGAVLALGNGTGTYLATHLAIKKGSNWVRIYMCVAVLTLVAKLLEIF
ncbi:MAG: integrase [Spirochaetae bacterium HGW-Spirochaetae-6]|nr:MAG: integrase [Spirochaetae bacterium HGW-Spirochaetae-6]